MGDTHFQHDYDFEEGEELELDGVGVLVQVGECVGRGVQDLSELLEKPLQEKEKRREARAAAAAPAPFGSPFGTSARPALTSLTPAAASWQARPKSLNQVLGTPSGLLGRASIPTRSPYEERQRNVQLLEKQNQEERPAKRRKPEPPPSKAGYAQNLTGATLDLSTPSSTPTARLEPSRPIIRHRFNEPNQPIDLTTDISPSTGNFGTSSHATLEASGIRVTKARRKERVEKSKPGKSGYAGNLTGVTLTLSGTYGKSRATGTGARRAFAEDSATLPRRPQSLQSPVRSEATGSTESRDSNLHPRDNQVVPKARSESVSKFIRADDGVVDITSSPARPIISEKAPLRANAAQKSINDASVSNDMSLNDSALKFLRDDDGFVGIIPSLPRPRMSKKAPMRAEAAHNSINDNSTSKDMSHPASNKRQKIFKNKPKSTMSPETPRPVSPLHIELSSHTSAPGKPNDETSEPPVEDEANTLRPLRIKSRPRRSMLISANRFGSRPSVDISHQSKPDEVATSRNSRDPRVDPSSAGKTADAPPTLEAQTHRDKSSSNMGGDPPFSKSVNSSNDMIELRQHTLQRKVPRDSGSIETERVAPMALTGKESRRVYEPPGSPEFEGHDCIAIDAMLSKKGNASPFAPKALLEAMAQQRKSSSAPNRTAERPLRRNAETQSLFSKLAKLQCKDSIPKDIAGNQLGSSRQIVNAVPEQGSGQQVGSGTLSANAQHASDQASILDSVPVLESARRKSSPALIPAPPVAVLSNDASALENSTSPQSRTRQHLQSDAQNMKITNQLCQPTEPPQIDNNIHNGKRPSDRRQLEDAQALDKTHPAENQEPIAEKTQARPTIDGSNPAPAKTTPPIVIPSEIIARQPQGPQTITKPMLTAPQVMPSPEEEHGNTDLIDSEKPNSQRLLDTGEALEQLPSIQQPPPPPKRPIIPNPATRGKKAAQKTDAAGKAPIHGPIFPVVVMAPPPAPASAQPMTRGAKCREIQNSGPPADSAGEARAVPELGAEADGNMGPWSREAFDLFDWRPPSNRSEGD